MVDIEDKYYGFLENRLQLKVKLKFHNSWTTWPIFKELYLKNLQLKVEYRAWCECITNLNVLHVLKVFVNVLQLQSLKKKIDAYFELLLTRPNTFKIADVMPLFSEL